MKRKGQLVRGILFVLILTAVLGVLLGAVWYWENQMMALPDAPERNESQDAAEKTDEPHAINMLLVIRTPGADIESGSLDSVVLCCINADAKTVAEISFRKDICVSIPGYSADCLGSAYTWGGMDLLSQTLEENFGVQTEITVEIDAENLSAVIDQLDGAGIQEMLNALDVFLEKSTSNLTDKELLSRMIELYPMLKDCTLTNLGIPAEGTYSHETVGGKPVLNIDLEANRKLLEAVFQEQHIEEP